MFIPTLNSHFSNRLFLGVVALLLFAAILAPRSRHTAFHQHPKPKTTTANSSLAAPTSTYPN
jgi:hypothetical protein